MTATEVKERPILMCGDMVCATLANRKRQTRRILKGAPEEWATSTGIPIVGRYSPTIVNRRSGEEEPGRECFGAYDDERSFRCPYGKPGDQLWVRENFWSDVRDPNECVIYSEDQTKYKYRTGGKGVETRRAERHVPSATIMDISKNKFWKQKPSIFMPRWASRIRLEITDVRVERVQDCSESDAEAEGVEKNAHGDGSWTADDGWLPYCSHYPDGCECFPAYTAKFSYAGLWKKINGEKSWDANPWVWVVEFKKLEGLAS